MSSNWGAALPEIVSPAGMIMAFERYDTASFCYPSSVHLRNCNDFITNFVPPDYGANSGPCPDPGGAHYVQSTTPGLRVQIASPGALLRSTNSPDLDHAYHQGGQNMMFCDGHAKWKKWAQTFVMNG